MTAETSVESLPDPVGSCLQLEATCTIREAAELKQRLLEHLESAQPLLIDASRVDKIDTAGVQLLVAFSLDCMERGTDFRWAGRSSALDRAIDLLGVAALVESPGVATPTASTAAGATNSQGTEE